ncbi:SDR family NAD(P)-dependent oxidoreductase [Pseudarthrobacter sp. J1738]|uniref:SDR family NAD(P)-dependent oxidoreductase n=1 Tax=Pseudarthrobacter sp. J1738 TaxID=3420446 RepID=UPI003D2D5260
MNTQPIALITGGNRGLGRAAALALAAAGTDVVITYRNNETEAAAVVAEVTAAGRKAVALQLDTTDFAAFPTFATALSYALQNTWSRDTFDFLVNNAGSGAHTTVGNTTTEDFDAMVNVHFKGPVFLTQELLPLISDGGRILNVSTGLNRFVGVGFSIYSSVKAAVDNYTRYLAKELGPRGITVNSIAPGPIATDFGGGRVRDDEGTNAFFASQTALGRVGLPEDIGGAIATLLAPGAGWITGQRIEASGGTLL